MKRPAWVLALALPMLVSVAGVWAQGAQQAQALAPQPREVFSPNRDYFVRIIPGAGLASFSGNAAQVPQAPFAQAEFYKRSTDRSYRITAEVPLLNPIAPAEFFVSDDGHLATVDNWRGEGLGKVVALYSPSGTLVHAYELSELFDGDEIAALPRTDESPRWRDGPAYIGLQPLTLVVTAQRGGQFVFGLETGRFRYCESRRQASRCRLGNLPRQWVVNGSVPLDR